MFVIIVACEFLGTKFRNSASLLLRAGVFGFNGTHAALRLNVLVSAVIGVSACLVAFGLMLLEASYAFLAVGLVGLLIICNNPALHGVNLSQNGALGIALVYIAKSLCSLLASFSPCYWLVRVSS